MRNPLETMTAIDTVNGAINPEPPMTVPQLVGNRIRAWVINPIIGD